MGLPVGTFTGRPEAVGDIADADSVLIHEFGSDPNLDTNQELIDYVYRSQRLQGLPMFVSGSIATAIRARRLPMDNVHVFEGPSASGASENTGTYGELAQLRDFRREHPGEFERPVLVTNGHNAGNIMRQSTLPALAITGLIVPPNLPRSFDWRSALSGQLWTSDWTWWAAFAPLRHYLLTRKGH